MPMILLFHLGLCVAYNICSIAAMMLVVNYCCHLTVLGHVVLLLVRDIGISLLPCIWALTEYFGRRQLNTLVFSLTLDILLLQILIFWNTTRSTSVGTFLDHFSTKNFKHMVTLTAVYAAGQNTAGLNAMSVCFDVCSIKDWELHSRTPFSF